MAFISQSKPLIIFFIPLQLYRYSTMATKYSKRCDFQTQITFPSVKSSFAWASNQHFSFLPLSFTHTHTQVHRHMHTHTHTHTHMHTPICTHIRKLVYNATQYCYLKVIYMCKHTHSLPLSLSLSHTHTHTHTHSRKNTTYVFALHSRNIKPAQ